MALVKGTNCGFVATAPTTDPAGSNTNDEGVSIANKDTSPTTAGKVVEIGWWLDNTMIGREYDVGIYSWDIGNNKPDELLGVVRNQSTTAAGWQVTEVDIAIEENTPYGISVQIDSGAGDTTTNYQNMAELRHNKDYQTELLNPWGTSSGTGSTWRAIYAVWEAAAVEGTNMQINIGDTWKEVPAVQINIGDVWKEVVSVKQNIGDNWKEVF